MIDIPYANSCLDKSGILLIYALVQDNPITATPMAWINPLLMRLYSQKSQDYL